MPSPGKWRAALTSSVVISDASFTRKGFAPARHSTIITPRANMSVGSPTSWPRSCSGDMYARVPITVPTPVNLAEPEPSEPPSFASPKSRMLITTRPCTSRLTKTFSGFRSRCTMPLRCAALTPSKIWSNHSATIRGWRPPLAWISDRRLVP